MKKFRFPLQSVATLRDLNEARAREAFGIAVQRTERCRDELEAIRTRVLHFVQEVLVQRERGLVQAAAQTAFWHAYQNELAAEALSMQALAKAEADQEIARVSWTEARLQKKLMEKLHTRARQNYAAEVARTEQQQLDERPARTNLLEAHAR